MKKISLGAAPTAKDPICGMTVDPNTAKWTFEHRGKRFFFCAQGCLRKFEAAPEKYLAEPPGSPAVGHGHGHGQGRVPEPGPGHEKAKPQGPTGLYTCPMDPEIVRDGPGDCPKCGMALEPMVATTSEEPPNPELADMTRRFWWSAAMTLPVLVLAMGELGYPLLQLALATPVVLWGGAPFFRRAWRSIATWNLNMFTLIGIGTGVAWTYSTVAALAPGIFPSSFRAHGGGVGLYFEASAVITTLVLLGQVLELRARGATSSAIRSLLRLAPTTARRLADDGSEEDVPLERVRPGDRLRVRPGEKVPVDGVVL